MTTTAPESARSCITTAHRGDVRLWTQTLIPTSKEAPADAEAPSHVFLSRAGYIRKVGAGVYDYLPLAWRVLTKISDIIRDEMDSAGASEFLMPAMAPMDLLEQTGRAEAYGDLLFKLEDRHDRAMYLGPTHEEVITDLVKSAITSYKQLPLNLYQIQTKFRDEFRPRAGLLRCREFIMKDAYSFSTHVEGPGGLNEQYDAMYTAYENIFRRCGLDFSIVEAEAGPIGGSASHEFMVNCDTGEDTIMVCPASGYAANVEKCEIGDRDWSFDHAPAGDLETKHTPNLPGIEGVAEHLGTTPSGMLKTVLFQPEQEQDGVQWVLAVVRGDHDANEGKVRDAVGFACEIADPAEANKAGFTIGYVSPRAAMTIDGCKLLIDKDAANAGDWATGSDKKDHHDVRFNWKRDACDLIGDAAKCTVTDIRNAEAGDPSPRAPGAFLEAKRGIEVGHIFKLGTKYSEAMGFEVPGQDQKRAPVIMGCYGIGVSRTMAACVEMSCDDWGIRWPMPIAPYHVLITVLKPDAELLTQARTIAAELSSKGFDVLIDDRDERPGGKFKDADLIGIPVRFTLSVKSIEAGGVEYKLRTSEGKGEVLPLEDAIAKTLQAAEA